MKLDRFINPVLEEIRKNLTGVDDEQIENMINNVIYTKARGGRIFTGGAGRSGLVAKSFSMRLFHLGFDVSVLGETIVPPINNRDTLLAISGSGKTQFTVDAAEIAKQLGAKVIAITSKADSPLTERSDVMVVVRGRTKDAPTQGDYYAIQLSGIHAPLSPLGSMFEMTCMIFLEGIISELMARLEISEESLKEHHTNIETLAS